MEITLLGYLDQGTWSLKQLFSWENNKKRSKSTQNTPTQTNYVIQILWKVAGWFSVLVTDYYQGSYSALITKLLTNGFRSSIEISDFATNLEISLCSCQSNIVNLEMKLWISCRTSLGSWQVHCKRSSRHSVKLFRNFLRHCGYID